MATDEERREVAARLRKLHLSGGSKDLIELTLTDAIGAMRSGGMSWDFITERLADLIDPDTTTDTTKYVPVSPIASPTVDRDVLLKLADEMYRDGRIQLKRQRAGERQFIDGLDVMEYAQRMRKALGVADADE